MQFPHPVLLSSFSFKSLFPSQGYDRCLHVSYTDEVALSVFACNLFEGLKCQLWQQVKALEQRTMSARSWNKEAFPEFSPQLLVIACLQSLRSLGRRDSNKIAAHFSPSVSPHT